MPLSRFVRRGKGILLLEYRPLDAQIESLVLRIDFVIMMMMIEARVFASGHAVADARNVRISLGYLYVMAS